MRKVIRKSLQTRKQMNPTKQLRAKLISHMIKSSASPEQVKTCQKPNPYPIGTRAVYVFAKGGDISDSHKWKLYVYFLALNIKQKSPC